MLSLNLITEIGNTMITVAVGWADLPAAQKLSFPTASPIVPHGAMVPNSQAVFAPCVVRLTCCSPEVELPWCAVRPLPNTFLFDVVASKPDIFQAPAVRA